MPPILDAQGDIADSVMVFHDVTEQRRNDDTIRESEKRFAALVRASAQAVWVADAAGAMVEFSPTWSAFTGQTVEEMKGWGRLSAIHPDDHATVKSEWKKAIAARSPIHLEYRLRHVSGEWRWTTMRAVPLLDDEGAIRSWVAMNTDITERRAAEERLRESENRKSAILNAALDAIITMDHHGKVTDFNPAAEKIFGYSSRDAVGKLLETLIIPERLRERHREGMKHYLATGEGPVLGRRIEMPALRADGTEFPVELSISRISNIEPPMFTATLRDITQRKQAEREVKLGRERLELALAAGGLGDWEWNTSDDIVLLSPRAAEIFGLSELTTTWAQMREVLHPEDRERAQLAVEKALADRSDYDTEYRVIRDDGELVWVAARGRGRYTEHGRAEGMSGVVTDVTEHKRAEEMRSRLAAVVESSDDAIISMDLNAIVTTWNKGAEQTFGYDAAEMVGKSITILIPPGRENEEPAILARLVNGERIEHYETVRVSKDGTPLHVSLSVSPILNAQGQIVGASKISRDITARKHAEEALRHSEDELRALANSMPQLAWMAEPDGHIFWYNHRWYEYTGTNFEQMQGWGWQSVHDPKMLPLVVERWKQSLATGEPFDMEFPLRGADGVFRWFLTRVNPVRGSEGRITRWFGTNTDVDAVRKAQEALREETRILELLNDTGSAIAANLDLQSVVQTVTDAATKLTGAQFGAFFYNLINAQGESFLLYTLSGAPRSAFEKFGMPRNTPIFNPTFTGQGVVRSRDITKDPRYGKMAPHHGMPKGHLPVRSYLAVPVISRNGEVIGGLFFGHPEPDVFTERAERLVVGVAAQATIAIDNARLYDAAQKEITRRTQAEEALARRVRLAVLRAEISSALAVNEDLRTVLQHCTEAMVKNIDAAFARIWTLNEHEQVLELCASAGMYTHLDGPHSRIKVGEYKIGRIAKNHEPHLTNDVANDPNISDPEWARQQGMVAFAGYPLMVEGSVNGVVALFARHPLSEEVFKELSLVTDGLAQWIQRKQAERALGEAQKELSRHAENLEKEVATRTASLREAITQLEEFSYSVSHDLRAPLRAIAGYNRIFREDFGATLPANAHVYLEKITRSTERMERLVNDVLTMSRVARADIALHPISLQRFIEEIIEQHPEMQAPAADLTIHAPHKVIADDASLGQALSNLLTNAVKFLPADRKPVVTVRSEQSAGLVRIWIADNGIGIPPQHRAKLFGMFQRLPADLQYEGTGIGLAIVRKAVDRMGGTLGMESNEPMGSRFWIELKGAR